MLRSTMIVEQYPMRQSDPKPIRCFRTDRFFVVSGRWYFTTREREDFGPFANREEAETRLAQYLDTQSIMQYLRAGDPQIIETGETSLKQIARLSSDLHRAPAESRQAVIPGR
jgi:hypothetical protein